MFQIRASKLVVVQDAEASRKEGEAQQTKCGGIAVKNQVCTCASLLVRRPLFLICVMLDATLEAVEVAGSEPVDVPPGEPRSVV